MKYKIFLVCLFLCTSITWAGESSIFMGKEIYLPSGWTEGKMINTVGGVHFVAPMPDFDEPTKVGAYLKVNRVITEKTVIVQKIPAITKKVGPLCFVRNLEKRLCKIEHNRIYKINGIKYKAVGESPRLVHFYDIIKKKIYVVPTVKVIIKKAASKKEEK